MRLAIATHAQFFFLLVQHDGAVSNKSTCSQKELPMPLILAWQQLPFTINKMNKRREYYMFRAAAAAHCKKI